MNTKPTIPSYTYVCHFTVKDQTKQVASDKGISYFCEGFWVNDKFEIGEYSDIRYWIPASRIEFIEKVPYQ
jgi:hypothetical protein